MSLRQSVDEYLSLRRHLGFKLEKAGHLLSNFATYMETAGASTVTIALALDWAKQPAGASATWWQHRLSVVRGFAHHLHGIDPRHEVPPSALLPGLRHRDMPHIFTEAEISRLMDVAGNLSPDQRATTYTTMVGLLACTGMRSGEALRLDRGDVDWDEGILSIRFTKFGKSRQLVLHPTTVDALRRYDDARRRWCPRPSTPAFFVLASGARVRHANFHYAFREIVKRAGLEPESAIRRPRPHDFRHTFAVNTLIGWYRCGLEINAKMHLLSTYLGHSHPRHTYWYLSTTPTLLAFATQRLEATQGVR